MTNQHPITPPLELVVQWINKYVSTSYSFADIANEVAQWGADQELEACCQYISGEGEWFAHPGHRLAELRTARRPKPPSLKAQALAILDDAHRGDLGDDEMATIRRALEALPSD